MIPIRVSMFTRRFWGWIGVGVLATLAIPTLAAPHVAKLLQRRAPVKAQQVSKPAAKKPTTKATTQPVQTAGSRQRLSQVGPTPVKVIAKRQSPARIKKRSR